jgi:hypothetical protein
VLGLRFGHTGRDARQAQRHHTGALPRDSNFYRLYRSSLSDSVSFSSVSHVSLSQCGRRALTHSRTVTRRVAGRADRGHVSTQARCVSFPDFYLSLGGASQRVASL